MTHPYNCTQNIGAHIILKHTHLFQHTFRPPRPPPLLIMAGSDDYAAAAEISRSNVTSLAQTSRPHSHSTLTLTNPHAHTAMSRVHGPPGNTPTHTPMHAHSPTPVGHSFPPFQYVRYFERKKERVSVTCVYIRDYMFMEWGVGACIFVRVM